jgi:mono/diheme cytochrome c family protein
MRTESPPITSAMLLLLLWAAVIAGAAARQASSDVQPTAEQLAALMDEGQAVFGADCAACHGAEGSEGAAPALAGNASLASKEHVIRQILEGNPARGMPPFAQSLTDRKVAAVGTFIRSAWDNAHGVVLEADVKRLRDEIARKK